MKIDEQGRHALIVALAERTSLGRTAVMKMMFFLQEVRSVPLCYDFRIYTYGPYDTQVLEDLRLTEAQGGVISKRIEWPGGSGVEINVGERAEDILSKASSLISTLSVDLDWVASEFGKKSASDLEVLSTVVFIDRSSKDRMKVDALASKVHALKPHHSLTKITNEIENLRQSRLLNSLL